MTTRVGKIARLPSHIRDELNHRLANGARGIDVVAWLNTLPEVQTIMAELFRGQPIRQQNLSEWRHGGYAEWSANRGDRAHWQDLLDHIEELSKERTLENGKDVTSHLGTLVVLELAQALDQLNRMEDSAERWKIFRRISLSLSRLRRDDCREERIRLSDSQATRKNDHLKPVPANTAQKKNSFLIPSSDLQSASRVHPK
jgi:hypothetical protein